jgi:uncharacterized protein (TIGR02588 family)
MASRTKSRKYPLVELLSAAIGVVITAGMFGFLAMEAVRQRNGLPPMMTVEPVAIVAANGIYAVEVDVRNIARKTGANVRIEGSLKQGDATVETSIATVDYVPGGSNRSAGLLFTEDPRKYRLELRVTGYERP